MFNALSKAKLGTKGVFLMTGFAFLPYLARHNIVVSLLLLGIVCLLPGLATIQALRLKFNSKSTHIFFGLLLSLLILMVIFTLFSVLTHICGLGKPFSSTNVYFLMLSICLLSIWFLKRDIILSINSLSKSRPQHTIIVRLLFWLMPSFALFSVSKLNNQANSIPTTCFLLTLLFIFLIIMIFKSIFEFRLNNNFIFEIIYLLSFSLLLGSSFRGSGGFWNFDINSEYYSAHKVLDLGYWMPNGNNSAYDSMLSITVLPVAISIFTKLNLVLLFKLFYPAVLAFIPAVLFIEGIKYFSRLTVLVVLGATTLGSSAFIADLPALARQIIATSFFLGLILVPHQKFLTRRQKISMVISLAMGVSISHYSTSYVLSALFATMILFRFFVFIQSPRTYSRRRGIFTASTSIGIILVGFIWNGVITQSVDAIKPITSQVLSNGLHFLPNTESNLFVRWISGTVPTKRYLPKDLRGVDIVANQRKGLSAAPESLDYPIVEANSAAKPLFGEKSAEIFSNVIVLSRSFFQLSAVLGTFLLVGFSLSLTKLEKFRTVFPMDNLMLLDLFPLALAALAFGLIGRTSGTLAPFYNPQRLGVTLVTILFMPSCLLLELLLFRSNFLRVILTGPIVFSTVALLVSSTSLGGYLLASDTTRISAINADKSPFVISSNERIAASWLAKNIPSSEYLQTDSRGYLVLLQQGRKPNYASIDPYSLQPHSYVYASNSNVVGGVANSYILYKFPRDYITKHYDLIYSSPRAQVYH